MFRNRSVLGSWDGEIVLVEEAVMSLNLVLRDSCGVFLGRIRIPLDTKRFSHTPNFLPDQLLLLT